jgi:hypothetical protein
MSRGAAQHLHQIHQQKQNAAQKQQHQQCVESNRLTVLNLGFRQFFNSPNLGFQQLGFQQLDFFGREFRILEPKIIFFEKKPRRCVLLKVWLVGWLVGLMGYFSAWLSCQKNNIIPWLNHEDPGRFFFLYRKDFFSDSKV